MVCMAAQMMKFFQNKRVFVTGHSGFKGAWLCAILTMAGAKVTGFSLRPSETKSLFMLSGLESKMISNFGDIRNYKELKTSFDAACPEIVIHMAAQPIVRVGYKEPVYTYETNVMGTVHLLECIRTSQAPVKSVVNITTDKVYQNKEWVWGYRENDTLNGFDPYANSKSCSEFVTDCFKNSFLQDQGTAVSTARAGNVIGGGDFAVDRIIPDCIRAAMNNVPIQVRNPASVRPYQHVLDPLAAYLLIAQRQYEEPNLAGCYNIGPDNCDCVSTSTLVDIFCRTWGDGVNWECKACNGPHEDKILKLDCSKIKDILGWKPHWHIEEAVARTVYWTKAWINKCSPLDCMEKQIKDYFQL